MKILLDQMSDGWYDRLLYMGHDVYSVTNLRSQGHSLQKDPSVAGYAKDNGMVLVAKDTKLGRYCQVTGIPCILLDDDELYKVLLEKIGEYDEPADG